MQRRYCRWSDDEEKILRQIAENGGTIVDAMSIFPSRSKNSIWNKCDVLGLSLAGPKPEINEEAFKEFLKARGIDGSNGKPDRQIRG